MQKMSTCEPKSVVAIDRDLLFQAGRYHRFDFIQRYMIGNEQCNEQ